MKELGPFGIAFVIIVFLSVHCCDGTSQQDLYDNGINKLSTGRANEVTDAEKRVIENHINKR